MKNSCHKNHMEILVGQDLAEKHQVELSDFFVNEKKSLGTCKIKPHNETHSRFWIPYEKCSTHSNVSIFNIYCRFSCKNKLNFFVILKHNKHEKVYKNRLYFTARNEDTGQIQANLIMEFECRLPKHSHQVEITPESGSIETSGTTAIQRVISPRKGSSEFLGDLKPFTNEKISKSTTPCLIDLLSLRIRLFHDANYFNEIKIDPEATGTAHNRGPSRASLVEYAEQVFVQFSVFHSDKLAEFSELKDKLKYFHLTIERCWLTRTKEEDSHVLQTLIQNGYVF